MAIQKSNEAACVLAIGGLDPGGGAGLAADLRAIGAAGAFGCAVCAVVTVQSTSGLKAARALAASEVLAQAREVLRHQRVRAFKTGALGSEGNVRAVGKLLAEHADVPAVVDPVMLPTRGRARLLAERAIDAMRTALVKRATLVTANAPEAEALTGKRVANVSEAHDAALALCRMGARAALVKGGHLAGEMATDVLALDGEVVEIRARRLRVGATHGGGCVLASLIAGRIAADGRNEANGRAGSSVPVAVIVDAVRWGKRVHHGLLAGARDVGGAMRVLVP